MARSATATQVGVGGGGVGGPPPGKLCLLSVL